MTRTQRRAALATGAVAVIALVAVVIALAGGRSGDGSATPKPSVSASPSKILTAEEKAAEQAKDAALEYYRVMDHVAADPRADTDLVRTVSIGTGLNDALNRVAFNRSKQQRQIGTTQIPWMKVRSVDLTFKPKSQHPEIPVVQLDVCYDVSKVNVVDETGKSVVLPTRKNRALEQLGVANYQWPNPHGWKVAYSVIKGSRAQMVRDHGGSRGHLARRSGGHFPCGVR
jgi:hypothetical protein